MKYDIAKKFPAVRKELGTEPNFTDQRPAERRLLSVNRKSMPLLAMKYAIGRNCFHVLRAGALEWWPARDHLL